MKLKMLFAGLVFSISAVAITGCSSAKTSASSSEASQAIAAAKKAQKDTSSIGFEWRDTGKMIKKAEKLAKEGKDKEAIKIANSVVMQSKVAMKQAEVAKTAGPRF